MEMEGIIEDSRIHTDVQDGSRDSVKLALHCSCALFRQ